MFIRIIMKSSTLDSLNVDPHNLRQFVLKGNRNAIIVSDRFIIIFVYSGISNHKVSVLMGIHIVVGNSKATVSNYTNRNLATSSFLIIIR